MPKPVEVTLPSDTEVQVVRVFDAPARLVWDAHTKPELITRWLVGQPGWTMPVCEVDLTVGGAYRYRWRNEADGFEFGSSGVHREIVPYSRIVTTERMEGFEGEAVNTLTLVEAGGRTTLTMTMKFQSTEARDGAVKTGMTDGMAMGYDLLDGILLEQKVG